MKFRKLLAGLAMTLTAAVAQAGLGDHVADDAPGLQQPAHANFPTNVHVKVQDLTVGKLRVRQFVTSTGTVFGTAWQGRADNEVATMLSGYNGEYQNYETTHPKRAGRIPYRKVDDGKIIVEYWDLLRNVRGRAYVPALVPEGLDPASAITN